MPSFEFAVTGTRIARVSASTEAEARVMVEQNLPFAVEWGVFDPTDEVVLVDTDDDDDVLVGETITATTRTHLTSREVEAEIRALPEPFKGKHAEFSDGAALAVASWFASPGTVSGRIMAQLSTTGTVVLGELLDAIRSECLTASGSTENRQLDLLATWALNHPSRVQCRKS